MYDKDQPCQMALFKALPDDYEDIPDPTQTGREFDLYFRRIQRLVSCINKPFADDALNNTMKWETLISFKWN